MVTGQRASRREAADRLQSIVERAAAGRGAVVLVDGEPGIGKTTFLAEARRSAAGRLTVLAACAEPAEVGRPFGPILDALTGCDEPAPREVAESLAQLLQVVREPPAASGRRSPLQFVPDERVRLVEGLAGLLVAWSDLEAVMLTFDDLQWVDDATLAVLSIVARATEHHPIVLVTSMRRSTPRDAVRAFVEQRIAEGGEQIGLGPLAAVEVAALLADAAGAPAGPRLLGAAEGARGNPFLLLELVDTLDRHGQLILDQGVAEAAANAASPAHATVGPDVLARMTAFNPTDRRLLEMAALLGGAFSVTDLATILHTEVSELAEAVQSGVTAGLLEADGRLLRFRHELVREAVLATLPEPLVAGLHRQIGRALAESGADAARVAPHFLRGAEAGDASAAGWLREAATQVVHRAPAAAADLLERAHGLLPYTARERDAVATELVDAAFWCGRLDRAVEVAAEVLGRPQPAERAARLHETMARALALLGRPAEAVEHATALAGADEDPWGIGLTAMLRLFAMDLDGCLHDAERAARVLADAGPAADPWAQTLALSVQSFVLNIRGYHAGAAEIASRAVVAADGSDGMEAHRLIPLVFHGLALHSSGQEAAAQAAWQRGERLSDELGTSWAAPFFHYGRALAHWDHGRWDDVLAETEAALDFARSHDTLLAAGFACAISAAAHLFQLRRDAAGELLDEGDRLLARGGIQYGADWLVWIRALHLEAAGHPEGGLQLLDAAWQVASELRAEAALSLFGPDLIRMCVLAGNIATAFAVLDRLEAAEHDGDRTTVEASARVWRTALTNDRRGLDDVQRTFSALDRPVQVVFVEEAAMIGALVHGDATEARRRLSNVATGADALDSPGLTDRAERAAERLGMEPRLARRPPKPVTGWGSLTDTERAVARMVAAGDGNLDVAAAFGISRRTVESHLYRTYAKLGVRNRTELAIAAVRELA